MAEWIATMKAATKPVLAMLMMCEVCLFSTAFAEENVEPADAEEVAEDEQSKGILPIPDYSGDLWNRGYLTGDWTGTRDTLAGEGIQLNAEYFQYLQAVVDGGVDHDDRCWRTA